MLNLFIDSAVRTDVTRLLASGLFAGVTSNPAILDKAGLSSADVPDFVSWSTDAGAAQVFVQSWGTTVNEIADRGEHLRQLSPAVVVKVPASREGVEAARRLALGGKVLVTAVYSAVQVLPILASGAEYLAPFVGRMIANGREGIAEVIAMQRAVDATRSDLKILAGSIRTPEQMLELAAAGVHHFTFAPDVWQLFFTDELTAASVTQFEELATATVAASL